MVQEVLQWLAQQPSVHWLAPRPAVKLHNWQGTAIVQSAAAAPDAPVALTQDGGTHPIWAAGLTGAGQIIGGGDSGIGAHPDFFFCFLLLSAKRPPFYPLIHGAAMEGMPQSLSEVHVPLADRNNCFFNDPNVDWGAGLRTDPQTGGLLFDSQAHRKIRLYVEMADDLDGNGHGTHVMGSLLGSPFDISNLNNLDYRCGGLAQTRV
jgi:hypothetical protein